LNRYAEAGDSGVASYNWLVFDQFKAIVLSEIEQIARQV